MGLPPDTPIRQIPPHSPRHVDWGTEEQISMLQTILTPRVRRIGLSNARLTILPQSTNQRNHCTYPKVERSQVCTQENMPFLRNQ